MIDPVQQELLDGLHEVRAGMSAHDRGMLDKVVREIDPDDNELSPGALQDVLDLAQDYL